MEEEKDYTDQLDDNGKFAKGNQLHTLRKRAGRKSKISRFVQEFECVISTSHPVGYAIIYTDEELVFLTNRRLEEVERVDSSSLARWKKFEFADDRDRLEAERFRDLYEYHLLLQRDRMFEMMVSSGEKRSWGRWMSIIERKFDDWNLRHRSVDESVDRKQLVFRVESGDEGD